MATRRGHHVLMLGAGALLLLLAGCGSDDARNNPRPPQTIVVSAQISPERVSISPLRFGAGRITLIVANGTDQTARLAVAGPTRATTLRIAATESTRLPINIGQGTYRAAVIGQPQIKPGAFSVGPLRRSSDDQLLLP